MDIEFRNEEKLEFFLDSPDFPYKTLFTEPSFIMFYFIRFYLSDSTYQILLLDFIFGRYYRSLVPSMNSSVRRYATSSGYWIAGCFMK